MRPHIRHRLVGVELRDFPAHRGRQADAALPQSAPPASWKSSAPARTGCRSSASPRDPCGPPSHRPPRPRSPPRAAAGPSQAAAQRAATRPEAPRQRLIHHHHRRGLRRVRLGRAAARQQRNSHRLEISRRHRARERLRTLLRRGARTPLHHERRPTAQARSAAAHSPRLPPSHRAVRRPAP